MFSNPFVDLRKTHFGAGEIFFDKMISDLRFNLDFPSIHSQKNIRQKKSGSFIAVHKRVIQKQGFHQCRRHLRVREVPLTEREKEAVE